MDLIKWQLNFESCNFGLKSYLRFQNRTRGRTQGQTLRCPRGGGEAAGANIALLPGGETAGANTALPPGEGGRGGKDCAAPGGSRGAAGAKTALPPGL